MTAPTGSLNDIRFKTRMITKSPNESIITTAQLDQYINTFILYDMPEQSRLFNLRTTYEFETQAYVDTYPCPINPLVASQLNAPTFVTFHKPVYVAGYECDLFQSRAEFYRNYPITRQFTSIGAGDGSTTVFSGTMPNTPFLQNRVLITAVTDSYATLNVLDTATGVNSGTLSGDGTGTVNYVTGEINVTFTTDAPGVGQNIQVETIPYVASRPQAVLLFQDQFIIRPVPDKGYTVSMEGYITPTMLLESASTPELNEWWQYIAMGAATKIFEDRGDFDSLIKFRPLLDEYRRLAERRTIVQQTEQRAATIYTDQANYQNNNFYGSF